MRVLDAVSKLGRKGEVLVTAMRANEGDGVQFEIVPANSNIALRVADWLNSDADQVNFQDADEVRYGVATLVAGKRIRALGGTRGIRERRARSHGVGDFASLASPHRPRLPGGAVPSGSDRPERSGGRRLR